MLAGFSNDGNPDSNFGADGIVTTGFVGPQSDSGNGIVASLPDGRLIQVGTTTGSSGSVDIGIVCYQSNGSLDTTFGFGGKTTVDLNSGTEGAWGVAVAGDGRIVVVGATNGDFLLLRYNSNGTLDATFGNGGYVVTDFGSNYDVARSVSILPSGQILAAGGPPAGVLCSRPGRYNANGALDQASEWVDGRRSISALRMTTQQACWSDRMARS